MDGHRWPPFLWDHPPWGKDDQLLSGPSASVLRAIWSLTIIGRNHSSGFDRIWLINNSKLDFKLDPFKNVFCSFDCGDIMSQALAH